MTDPLRELASDAPELTPASAGAHDESHGLTWIRAESVFDESKRLTTTVWLNNGSTAPKSIVLNGFGLMHQLISPKLRFTGAPRPPAPPMPRPMLIPPKTRVRFETTSDLSEYQYELGERIQVTWSLGAHVGNAVAWGNFELVLDR